MKVKLQKLVSGVALAVVASIASAAPSLAQGEKVVDVIVDQKFVQQSCVTMMNGWEDGNSIDQPANIETGVKNESNNRMLVLTKNKDGQYYSVADLAPGESREFSLNEGTNFAWAIFGGHHNCVRGFSLTNGSTDIFK